MKKAQIAYFEKEQVRITQFVTKKNPEFYLTGGTALAIHYHHRLSDDLDFFSHEYTENKPERIIKEITKETGYASNFVLEQKEEEGIKRKRYDLILKDNLKLSIDFVGDTIPNIKALEKGIHTVEDIYYRKLAIALVRNTEILNPVGREVSAGRQTAKDIFDIHFLSNKYEPISEFWPKYFKREQYERIESWYRSMDRMSIMLDLNDIKAYKKCDGKSILRYLDDEILINLEKNIELKRRR